MKLTKTEWLRVGKWLEVCLLWVALGWMAHAQGFSTTTVQGTVYLANGHVGAGTLQVSWPSFTTTANQAVTAGRMMVTIGADGYVSVNLTPNVGASPAGLYYTAIYYLSDGTTSTEYWVIPAAAQVSLGQVRAEVMPAAQAVQAVSKSYVDQSITELSQSLLTASGGSLTGPLFLNGDPQLPTQAADKHYVDTQVSQAVPLSGGVMSGPLTSVKLGGVYQADQSPGFDFGSKLQACVNGLDATYGGTCDARNFTGNLSMPADLDISTANVTVQLPCATISTNRQVIVAAGTRNVTFHGCALRGASAASGSQGGTVFLYTGTGAMVQVGDPTYAVDTSGFHMDNAVINTTASNASKAQGMVAYRTQDLDLENLYFLGNSNQTGLTLDGTGNYTGGTFQDDEFGGFGTALNSIGHQVANSAPTDWMNASTFVRLHINCPTSGGSPISGTYGINLQQGDGNTFTGGDVEGCSTAVHLGPNAQNNTIVGLRNENSTNQVVADAGSSYNSWMTGGTMFAGQLTDKGTRNSFLDTFHRSFNGINGDWYGSQQDATLTNHYRIGIGTGNERGLLNRYQTDAGYRWTTGLSDATAGEQFYQVLDELNNVYRLSIGQYNNGQSGTNNQTVINAAGAGAVVLNGSTNAGTGGVLIGSGGSSGATVATINNVGNAQFNGTLQVGAPSTFIGSTTIKNQADAEIDAFLWAGSTTGQKESFVYKDWNGISQWYMVKDASNNWALNSAPGGLDSFKAYQNTNSGDTYINASNATGHIRLNYESGAGAETDIYSGSSSGLVAAFLGPAAIKLPGIASTTGRNCLQIDNSGYITNTGSNCGTGSINGTVNAGTAGQVAYYTGTGTAIAGTTAVSVTAGGTGATTPTSALANLGGQAAMPGVASDGGTGVRVSGTVAVGTAYSTVNAGTIATAEALLASGGTLLVNNTLTVASTHSTPANVTMEIKSGGGFNIAAGAVLNVNGPISAGRYQIFSGAGTASFAANSHISEIYPEWFGAVPGTDSTVAWQAALNAAASVNTFGGTVSCPNAVYPISNTLTSASIGGTAYGVSLIGPEGQTNATSGGCSLKWTGAPGGTMFHYMGGHLGLIQNINFDANKIAGRALWVDVQNTATGTSSITAISRASNVVTAQAAVAQTWKAGTNIQITGVTDSSFNGYATVWYAVDSTHYVFSQSGPDASSSGGTVAAALNADTQITVRRTNFYSSQSQFANVTSCTTIASPTRLSCTLAAPIVMYPNQWLLLTSATGALGGNYNAYWKVVDVQSPTQFTAKADQAPVDGVGITTGKVQGPSSGMSIGANLLAGINYSAYGVLIDESGTNGFGELDGGGKVSYPLAGFEVDGTANTKNFVFHDTNVNAARIGWLGFGTGGTFDCGGCGGTSVQDSVYAGSDSQGTAHIHDGEWEGLSTAYFVSGLISGSYLGSQFGTSGQFEFQAAVGNSGNLNIDNMNLESTGYAPDGVMISTTANTVLTSNYFQASGNFANPNVVTAVSQASAGTGGTPGAYQLTGIGGCTSNAHGDAGTNAVIAVSVNVGGALSSNMVVLDKGGNCSSAPTFTVPGSTATFNVTVGADIPYINVPLAFSGRNSLTSIGNTYQGVPKGGWIPAIDRNSQLYSTLNAYGGIHPQGIATPVMSMGDKTTLLYNIFPLQSAFPATTVRYMSSQATITATAESITSGIATLTTSVAHQLVPFQLVVITGMVSAPCLNAGQVPVLQAGFTANQFRISTACPDGSYTDSANIRAAQMNTPQTGMIQVPNNFPFVGAFNGTANGDDTLRFDASNNLQANLSGVDYQIPYLTAGLVPVANLPLGSNAAVGALKCDGTTTTCAAGVVTATATAPPLGTNTVAGIVKCDGITTNCAAGVVSATTAAAGTKVLSMTYPLAWWGLTLGASPAMYSAVGTTITRVYFNALGGNLSACSTQPTVVLKQGAVTLTTLTIPLGIYNVDSGVLSVAAAGGTAITISTTAGVGCAGGTVGFVLFVNYQ